MERIKTPIRRKLIFATLTPLIVAILLCWLIGSLLITDRIFRQAQDKVLSDLNLAHKVYQDEVDHLSQVVRLVALVPEVAKGADADDLAVRQRLLGRVLAGERLSFLNLIDAKGIVRYRSANPFRNGDSLADDPLVAAALEGTLSHGTQVYAPARLMLEGNELAQRAALTVKATPRARAVTEKVEERGLVLVAVAPLIGSDGRVGGALQAGFLLNGDSLLVDTITRIVFEKVGGGNATIFLDDVRIATNVHDAKGERAVGTLMSEAVAKVVLSAGKRWSDRAFVLSDWFISAYEPILSPTGQVIGAFYVGIPERPYLELRQSLNLIFGAVLLVVALIGITLSTWIGSRMARPVRALAEAARRMGHGERIEAIKVESDDEIGLLASEFNFMAREVTSLNQTLEEKVARRSAELEVKSGELLAAQKELARAERLAGLGILAAGVAHEINNPLAVIRGNAELLQSSIPEDDEDREVVDDIVEETARIGRIVNNLRAFSRGGIKRVSRFSLGELLDAILDQVGYQIPLHRYRIDREYWGQDVSMEGDEDQVRQVFTNLILNGLQSMPEGGSLRVAVALSGDHSVRVAVQDQGCGIGEADMAKLFTPFFTTKPRGTGLGLAVSYGIVKDHGGEIEIESEPGKGSTFTVIFPLRQENAPPVSG